jgi:hypothetical protein
MKQHKKLQIKSSSETRERFSNKNSNERIERNGNTS